MSESNVPPRNPEPDPLRDRKDDQSAETAGSASPTPAEPFDSADEPVEDPWASLFDAPPQSPAEPAAQKLPTSPPDAPPRVIPSPEQIASTTAPAPPPPPAATVSPVVARTVSVPAPTTHHQGLTLQTLLERPKHRWMVPAGFLLILGAFGLIGFVSVQADVDLAPNGSQPTENDQR